MQKYLKIILGITAGTCGLFLLSATAIVVSGLTDDIHQADVAVVLGNQVKRNGQPSARLQARLDRAAELFEEGVFPNVIVSGGFGAEGFDEAVVMKQYLINQGLPSHRIYLDRQGLTTALTARNSARIMQTNGWSRTLVISQYFHIPRTRLAFEQHGLTPIYAAHANFFEFRDLYSTAREVVGYGGYLLRNTN